MIPKQNVAILYGFGEGRWHGRKLRTALLAANFAVVDKPEAADIIIAHSGGMYALPEDMSRKTVLLIAPSCGLAGKTWLQTQSAKVRQDMNFFFSAGMSAGWFQKACWNGLYLITQAPRIPRLWRIHQQHKAGLPAIGAEATTVIIFKNDPWSGFLTAKEKAKHPDYTFITIDAIHDDIWLHPEKYVALTRRPLS